MTAATAGFYRPRLAARRLKGRIFSSLCLLMTLSGLLVLAVLIMRIVDQGSAWLSTEFLTSYPSTIFPEKSGVLSALVGTLWVITITAVFSIPVGIAAAIYLQEYARKTRLTRLIEINIANLAGVPSVVYGMLGLALFVRLLQLDRSVLSGGLTLGLLVLPVIIIASREALLAVPDSIRQAAYGLGATRWQTVRSHVLPAALPGIMTGVILALSRAIGEAAPLLLIGATAFVAFVPENLNDPFTVLPLQIYNWTDQPSEIFRELAAAAILVLLGILLPMNALAVAIRAWQQRGKVR